MVSKQLHCLNDLLFRTSTGDLQIDVPVVVSNHLDAEPLVKSYGIDVPPHPGHPRHQGRTPRRELMGLVDDLGIAPGRAGPLHADPLRPAVPAAERPGDQHPPLVPAVASRARSPTTRPSTGASSWSAPPPTTSPPTSTRARSSSRTSPASTTPTAPSSWSPPAATSRPRCCPARCAGTRRPGCCSTATGRSSSAERAQPAAVVGAYGAVETCSDAGIRIQRTG